MHISRDLRRKLARTLSRHQADAWLRGPIPIPSASLRILSDNSDKPTWVDDHDGIRYCVNASGAESASYCDSRIIDGRGRAFQTTRGVCVSVQCNQYTT